MNKKNKININNKTGVEKGFTLIELLIVISIALILMSFLLPKFNGYITKAKDLKAQNEAQQIYTAVMASYGEEGGVFDSTKINENVSKLVGSVTTFSATPVGNTVKIGFSLDSKQYSFIINPEVDDYTLTSEDKSTE